VAYRVGGPVILAFVTLLAMVYVINLELLSLWQMLLICAGGALAAPMVSLFFATFAENKVQGFAYSKFGGISGWAFLIGWFIPEPWQWLIGVFPPFWIGKAYWLALEGRGFWWIALLIGVVLQLVTINWLIKRFNQVAYR
jgi:fluoroquinolone transport system permease protein